MKVIMSPLMRAMLSDPDAREQLSKALDPYNCGGKVHFKGKTYEVRCGGGSRSSEADRKPPCV